MPIVWKKSDETHKNWEKSCKKVFFFLTSTWKIPTVAWEDLLQAFDLFIKSACLDIITILFYHWISIVKMIYSWNQKKEIPSIISTYNLSDDLLHGQNSSWIRNIWLWRNTSLALIQPTPSNSEIVNFISQRASAIDWALHAGSDYRSSDYTLVLASGMYHYNKILISL